MSHPDEEALRRARDEVERLRAENERLTKEIEETNRGVLALYAELDERAGYLERANALKSRFLSDFNHEIRTPLHSVRGIARLLLDGIEGPLSDGQRKAVEMISVSTDTLNALVDDWLDIARIEAGRTEVHVDEFTVEALFGSLRAVFRPLAAGGAVSLVFDDAQALPPMRTDQGKVAQVLRNLVSNALKFTERGEVRVSARVDGDDRMHLVVADTGIGIAPADLARVFEEFTRLASPLQRKVRGTGLGLALARRLAQLLGGDVTAESTLDQGSTFTLVLPRVHADP